MLKGYKWTYLQNRNSVTDVENKFRLPCGSVVKTPPANAGDMGSIPGLGRSHMPQSNSAHVPQPLSLFSRAYVPQLLKPVCTRACAPQEEKPLQWEVHALQQRVAPAHCN